MTAIRGAKIPNGYRFEYDLMQDVRDRINRKIEIDGEKAFELALAEVGYVKERTCKAYMQGGFLKDEPNAVEFSCGHFCLWPDEVPPKYCPDCGARVVE